MATSRRRRPPRQADVARLSGVSQSAVSRVIAGDTDSRIPERTRQRVLQAVAELGYVPNTSARSLRNKRNNLLGVHTFEAVFPHARESFYFDFLLGIEERAEELGYDLVLFSSTASPDGRRRVFRNGTNRLNIADGSVLLGVASDTEELTRLCGEGYPFVHIGRREVPAAQIPYVTPGYSSITERVVDKLVRLGHTHLTYLRSDVDSEPYEDRRAGYVRAMERHGLQNRPFPPGRGPGLASEWIDAVVAGPETAILAETEHLGNELLGALNARGLHVPKDVSIVVLEDLDRHNTPDVSWTSLRIPRKQIGRIAIDQLVTHLDQPDQPIGNLVIPCSITNGTTVAAPPERA